MRRGKKNTEPNKQSADAAAVFLLPLGIFVQTMDTMREVQKSLENMQKHLQIFPEMIIIRGVVSTKHIRVLITKITQEPYLKEAIFP